MAPQALNLAQSEFRHFALTSDCPEVQLDISQVLWHDLTRVNLSWLSFQFRAPFSNHLAVLLCRPPYHLIY